MSNQTVDERVIVLSIPYYEHYVTLAYKVGIKQAREFLKTIPSQNAKAVDWMIASMNFQAPKVGVQ